MSSEQKREGNKLPHYKGDSIFGYFVALWFLGLGVHIKMDVPALFFERWMLDDVDPQGWPRPVPASLLNNMWIPCVATFIYFTLMIHGPQIMKHRERPTWLKPLVFFWNILLSSFSSWGAWRIIKQVHNHFFVTGADFNKLVCEDTSDGGRVRREEMAAIWLVLFCLSKIPEMLDTLWLILGKKQVIFLHWFHHTSVMWFCWLAWGHGVPMGIPFAMMNLVVHSLMYMWYALAAANNWIGTGLKPTRGFSQAVTILQIVQMIAGSSVTLYILAKGDACTANERTVIYLALGMYGVYLILFMHFFIRAYCRVKKPLLRTPDFAKEAQILACAKCGHNTPHFNKKPAGGSSSSKKSRKKKRKAATPQRKN